MSISTTVIYDSYEEESQDDSYKPVNRTWDEYLHMACKHSDACKRMMYNFSDIGFEIRYIPVHTYAGAKSLYATYEFPSSKNHFTNKVYLYGFDHKSCNDYFVKGVFGKVFDHWEYTKPNGVELINNFKNATFVDIRDDVVFGNFDDDDRDSDDEYVYTKDDHMMEPLD